MGQTFPFLLPTVKLSLILLYFYKPPVSIKLGQIVLGVLVLFIFGRKIYILRTVFIYILLKLFFAVVLHPTIYSHEYYCSNLIHCYIIRVFPYTPCHNFLLYCIHIFTNLIGLLNTQWPLSKVSNTQKLTHRSKI